MCAMQIPGLEEGPPVDIPCDLGQVKIAEDASADELGLGGGGSAPVQGKSIRAGPSERQ